MKKLSFAKSLASVGLAAVCTLGIVGCSEQTSDTPTYTGGVAATVNGVEIPEDKVTQAIQDIRAQMSLTEEDAWGQCSPTTITRLSRCARRSSTPSSTKSW